MRYVILVADMLIANYRHPHIAHLADTSPVFIEATEMYLTGFL